MTWSFPVDRRGLEPRTPCASLPASGVQPVPAAADATALVPPDSVLRPRSQGVCGLSGPLAYCRVTTGAHVLGAAVDVRNGYVRGYVAELACAYERRRSAAASWRSRQDALDQTSHARFPHVDGQWVARSGLAAVMQQCPTLAGSRTTAASGPRRAATEFAWFRDPDGNTLSLPSLRPAQRPRWAVGCCVGKNVPP